MTWYDCCLLEIMEGVLNLLKRGDAIALQLNEKSPRLLGKMDVVDVFYYTAFTLYSVTAWLNSTVFQFSAFPLGEAIETIVQALVIALVFLSVAAKRPSLSRGLISLAIVTLAFVVWRISKEGGLFWASLLIVGAPEFNRCKLSKIVICVVIGVMVISTVAVLIGLFPMNIRVRSENGVIRNALGYLHPNNLGTAMSALAIAFCILRFDCFRLSYVPMYILLAVFTYLVPASRTASVLIVTTGFLWLVSSLAKGKVGESSFMVALFLIFAISLLASIIAMIAYDSLGDIVALLNKALSGRPYFAKRYYDASGITLFGYSFPNGPFLINDGETVDFLVDNVFEHVLLRYGMVPFIILFGMIALTYITYMKREDGLVIIFGLTMFMLMGICERAACQIECNFLLIVLSSVFEGRRARAFSDSDIHI